MSIKQATLFALRFMAFCEEFKIQRAVAARMCVLRQQIGRLAMGESSLTPRQRKRLDAMREKLVRVVRPYKIGVNFGNPYPDMFLVSKSKRHDGRTIEVRASFRIPSL